MSNGHGELLTLRMQREGSEPCVDQILILPGPRGRKTAKWKGSVEWTAGWGSSRKEEGVQVQGELASFTAGRQDIWKYGAQSRV